jgi:hypothetical protein
MSLLQIVVILIYLYEIPIAEKAKKNRIEGGVYMNNQEQHGNLPPAVISTKDHLYLEDMLNWNLLAMKKAHFMAEHCQNQTLKQELDQIGRMHEKHYQHILGRLNPGQGGQTTTGYMQ